MVLESYSWLKYTGSVSLSQPRRMSFFLGKFLTKVGFMVGGKVQEE